jgi:NAD(P)-dependent dehydrogenase (short-subunit alcohol dehydrogenase family)
VTAPQNTVEPGTVVLVTGGARGIGATLARSLARQGAAVVVADVVDAGPLVPELRAEGRTVGTGASTRW